MSEDKKFVIQDLSQLLRSKSPSGVLILEGDLKTWKDDGTQEGSITKTWDEALNYIRGCCDKLSIPYFSLSSPDFQQANSIKNEKLRKIIQDSIRSQYDLGLYVAGCLCCVEGDEPYLKDLRLLKSVVGGLERVFVASSPRGQNAPRGYVVNMPKDGYFLV